MIGLRIGARYYGWWAGVPGTKAGELLGALAGLLTGMLLVAVTGLILFGCLRVDEWRKARKSPP